MTFKSQSTGIERLYATKWVESICLNVPPEQGENLPLLT